MTEPLPSAAPQLEGALIEMAVESWRFSRVFVRALGKLGPEDAARFASQLRYFQKKLEETLSGAGLKLVNVEGAPFDPGMAATALNVGDFAPEDQLVVEQMLEPIIMGADTLRKPGTVVLRKVDV
jgi:hypothetical protein